MITPDEKLLGLTSLDLGTLKRHAEQIASQWDGKEPGRLEDLAMVGHDIMNACDDLDALLDEFAHI